MTSDLAVFTVVYPAALPFVPDMLDGLAAQTDDRYTLIVALDLVDPEHFARLIHGLDLPEIEVRPVGGTPIDIRNKVLSDICLRFSAVVLQDADDVPRPGRVAAQRTALHVTDVTASALELIDASGRDLHRRLRAPRSPVDAFLPRMNVFGFGNSAYRSEVLRECLPVPPSVVAMDWFVATHAHLNGAVLSTSDAVAADYRQHEASAAPVLPALALDDIHQGVRVCQAHLTSLREARLGLAASWVATRLEELNAFDRWIRRDERNALRYLEAVNGELDRVFAWWEYIAAKPLEQMWRA